jgi:predicted nucleic acid-binding protein
MVKALLDTNILIDFLNGVAEARSEMTLYPEKAISIVTWMEIMVGAAPEVQSATGSFLSSFEIVGLDGAIAEQAVALWRERRIKLPDAIIWASARQTGSLLITRNKRDFPVADPSVRVPYHL